MIGIYKITNKKNGKIYIGQATDVDRRISEHKQRRTQTIDNYINCLGVDNFDFEIIEECSKDELDSREQFYIQKFNTQKNGYNIQNGGYNNSAGSGNGRALLNEKIVIDMRKAYANHESPKEFFEKIKYTGITKGSFQAAWQGNSWSYIMPEVFSEENKKYYAIQYQRDINTVISKEDVLKYRKYYVNHSAKEVYELVKKDYGEKAPAYKTVQYILTGYGRKENYYSKIPLYSKKKKQWTIEGKPVSTIVESNE